nr:MAG TPA: Structural Protein [Caudoviricetes sp.]
MANVFVPVNGAPTVIALGTDDKSLKQRRYERAPRAIHLPLVYDFAEWGDHEDIHHVYGNTIGLTYGDKTLDMKTKYTTHATPYLQLFLTNANPIMFKRLVPKDIGPKASMRISMDVLEEELDEYVREVDGSFKRDTNGDLVTTGNKIKGYLVKFTKQIIPIDPSTHESTFGKATITTGTQTNARGENSKVYPILDLEAPHLGEKGNNFGIRLWAPTTLDSYPIKTNIFEKDKVYPFRASLISRLDAESSAKVVNNIFGEKLDDFCLKPGLVDKDYAKERYINDILVDNYQDLNPSQGNPLRYGPFGRLRLYDENVERVAKLILEEEARQAYTNNDLFAKSVTGDSEDFYLVNLFGLQQKNGIPYQCARFVSGSDAVRFTENTNHWLDGASDGTMTNEEFARLVAQEMDRWGDPDDEYQDFIQYPCSYFWDSGFPLETKYKIAKFIAHRKNTNVSLATYIDGERPLTTSEEFSRHIAIIENVRIFADSDYFATPTFRASVVSRSGKPLQSTYKKRLPCNFELANMISRMAAGTSFKSTYLFDRVPYNKFELLGSVESLWAPTTIRNRDWAMGMMWPERLSQNEVYFPAGRSVYKDDTSVLTSVFAGLVVAECQTVGMYCQKQFSGIIATKPQLKARVEDYCRENLKQRFAEMVRIEPTCYFTDADNSRGYSWTLRIAVWLPMMRTVETLYVEVHDLDYIEADSPAFVS